MTPATDIVAGRYVLDRELGRGGVGAVHLAYDTQLERWVAIKRIHTDTDEAFVRSQAAIAEAKRLASIQHPNIVTVFDFLTHGEDVLVVMEFLPGHTLDELPAPLGLSDFLSAARQSLEGLAAAHSLGMIHRDIKPGNIMLTALASGGFQVKLLDFGLAKIIDAPAMQTIDHSGSLLGSIHTMAPEQFEQRPLDQRMDLYSLGCVLYRALTLEEAFTGETVAAVMAAHLQHRFTPVAARRPDVPPAICAWLERMFSRDAADRPQGAREALAELNRAARGEHPGGAMRRIEAKPVRPATTTIRLTPRRRGPRVGTFIVAGGVLAAAGIFGAVMWSSAPQAQPPAPVTQPSDGDVIAATDRPQFMKRLGSEVVAEGIVERMGESRTGTVRYLNFAGSNRTDLALVFFVRGTPRDFSAERLGQFIGKKVRVRGVVREFQGNPQIEVDDLAQIEVVP